MPRSSPARPLPPLRSEAFEQPFVTSVARGALTSVLVEHISRDSRQKAPGSVRRTVVAVEAEHRPGSAGAPMIEREGNP